MRLLLYGSRDFARLIAELARQCGLEVAGFIDDFNAGPDILGTYNQCLEAYPPPTHSMAIAIGYGDLQARWAAYEKARKDGYAFPTLIHPRACISGRAKIGPGCIVMAGANVDSFAELDALAVLWPSSVVSHDCRIGANCFLSPNSTVCGFTRTGENCFIGAGATVTDHVEVPARSFVKAGTVFS